MAINSLALRGEGCHKELVGAVVLMRESKKHIEAFSGELRIIAILLLYFDIISLYAEIAEYDPISSFIAATY
jgi:hypothetical protein